MNHSFWLSTAFLLCLGATSALVQSTGDADPALVDRGRALATAADCSACHATPQGGSHYGGGLGIEAPMGTIFASNITPDPVHGIGRWSLEDFSRAVREGRSPTNGWLYPAMPYTAYTGLSDADVKALYSYFKLGVEPSDHAVKPTSLPFPFMRIAMLGWNMLFLNDARLPGSDAAPGSVERGHYLAEALAHCSTCHTTRNGLMAEDGSKYLAGSVVGNWYAPNITSGPDGIGPLERCRIASFP